jgi:hypothetical protein
MNFRQEDLAMQLALTSEAFQALPYNQNPEITHDYVELLRQMTLFRELHERGLTLLDIKNHLIALGMSDKDCHPILSAMRQGAITLEELREKTSTEVSNLLTQYSNISQHRVTLLVEIRPKLFEILDTSQKQTTVQLMSFLRNLRELEDTVHVDEHDTLQHLSKVVHFFSELDAFNLPNRKALQDELVAAGISFDSAATIVKSMQYYGISITALLYKNEKALCEAFQVDPTVPVTMIRQLAAASGTLFQRLCDRRRIC